MTMEIGSYLDNESIKLCQTKVCHGGVDFVSQACTKGGDTYLKIHLGRLLSCSRSGPGPLGNRKRIVDEVAKRIYLLWTRHKTESRVPKLHVRADSIDSAAVLLRALSEGGVRKGVATELASCQPQLWLDFESSNVCDLSALPSYQGLDSLGLRSTRVNDTTLATLVSWRNLRNLILWRTSVSDASVFASMPWLEHLSLGGTQVRDVTALASCQSLDSLDLSFTKVRDVSVLAHCRSLRSLTLRFAHVDDVSALASCPSLEYLNLDETWVSGLMALASSKSLRYVFADDGDGAEEIMALINARE
jgi:hypothetical protein